MDSPVRWPGGKVLEIRTVGDAALRQKARPVAVFDEDLSRLIADMLRTMYAADGIGLAAPQVGESLSLLVMDVRPVLASRKETCELDGKNLPVASAMPMPMVNPVIRDYSSGTRVRKEGCLSVPEFRGEVERPEWVKIDFVDGSNAPHSLSCGGMLACCAQHEIDHLNGILYVDRLSKSDTELFLQHMAGRKIPLAAYDNGNAAPANNFQR
jgi:peptide deformylase